MDGEKRSPPRVLIGLARSLSMPHFGEVMPSGTQKLMVRMALSFDEAK